MERKERGSDDEEGSGKEVGRKCAVGIVRKSEGGRIMTGRREGNREREWEKKITTGSVMG